jgi:hypothetical protein
MVQKIISGGQTGVDRAGLDVALDLDLAVGGWCPKGWRAEDGMIPKHYPLVETPERNDQTRTRRNIEDADGTLILNLGAVSVARSWSGNAAGYECSPLWTPWPGVWRGGA